MPSNIQSFPVEIDNGNGTTTRLPSKQCKVYNVAGAVDIATVTTDANGFFPLTGTSLNPGSLVRIRIENHLGKAGYIETVTV